MTDHLPSPRHGLLATLALAVAALVGACSSGAPEGGQGIKYLGIKVRNDQRQTEGYIMDVQTGERLNKKPYTEAPSVSYDDMYVVAGQFYNVDNPDEPLNSTPFFAALPFGHGDVAPVVKTDHSHISLVDRKLNTVAELPREVVSVTAYYDDVARYKTAAGKWGLVDDEGKIRAKATYDFIGAFMDGVARAERGDSITFIKPSGEAVLTLKGEQYAKAGNYMGGLIPVETTEGETQYIDLEGKVVVDHVGGRDCVPVAYVDGDYVQVVRKTALNVSTRGGEILGTKINITVSNNRGSETIEGKERDYCFMDCQMLGGGKVAFGRDVVTDFEALKTMDKDAPKLELSGRAKGMIASGRLLVKQGNGLYAIYDDEYKKVAEDFLLGVDLQSANNPNQIATIIDNQTITSADEEVVKMMNEIEERACDGAAFELSKRVFTCRCIYEDGSYTEYWFDNTDKLWRVISSSDGKLEIDGMERNANHQLTSCTFNVPESDMGHWSTYTYDELGRLAVEKEVGSDYESKYTYHYNAAGEKTGYTDESSYTEMGADEPGETTKTEVTVKHSDYDSHGNWRRAVYTSPDGSWTVTRVIDYHI